MTLPSTETMGVKNAPLVSETVPAPSKFWQEKPYPKLEESPSQPRSTASVAVDGKHFSDSFPQSHGVSSGDTTGTDRPATASSGSAAGVVGLHRWEGWVTDIDGDIFSAELRPLDHEGPPLIADFNMALLAVAGEEVYVGSSFYLTTRMIESNGRNESTSSLRLRRLGRWKESDLLRAKVEAHQLEQRLQGHAD
jgi:hypothetical protein